MKTGVLGFALVLLAGALPGQRLFATQNCGNQDFNGAFGILASGAITVPGFPITGPFARALGCLGLGKVSNIDTPKKKTPRTPSWLRPPP